jgi:hypothetical protein
LQVPDYSPYPYPGATLAISAASTGSLEAVGGKYGAGIGSGYSYPYSGYNDAGTISIAGGTVTATGGEQSAGIGGSDYGAGGTIAISGGTVTATGGSDGAGIGGGRSGEGGTITTLSGNAVVIASSIDPALPSGNNLTNAIVFNGVQGTMYGNVTLSQDLAIPAGHTLFISYTDVLTINPGKTLTNNGTIQVAPGGSINGTVTGNQPKPAVFTVTGGTSYSYVSRVLTITGDGTYTIGMAEGVGPSNYDRIVVASGVTADITLNGVNIDISGIDGACAFDMTGAAVNLTLLGSNILKSGGNKAGLQVPADAALAITAASTGSLEATGGNGAGIGGGGGDYGAGGTISISGGTDTATGDSGGAGIGGGRNGAGGTITALSGNAVVFASSIAPTLTAGDNATQAIAFNGNAGTMYGNVTLDFDVTIPSTHTLDLSSGQTLTIGSHTLTNEGTINKNGGTISGNVGGSGTVNN